MIAAPIRNSTSPMSPAAGPHRPLGRPTPSDRVVRPAAVLGVELPRGVLRVALDGAAACGPDQQRDARSAADHADDAPDRVGEGGERQDQVRSTTIVLTDAVTPSATSTTTT